MRRWFVLLAWLLLAGPVFAQGAPADVSAADRTAIQGLIRRQLDAFQQDDAGAAYAAAAPEIRRLFPDAAGFMAMVRNAYPPVYRSRSAEFSELAMRDGALVQEVELVGPDGKPALALYSLERQPDGTWRISGCVLIPSARLSV